MADVRLRDLNPAEFNYGVNVAGNLGVGTTSPNAKVEIRSDGSDAAGAEIRLQHANNNSTDIVSTVNFANNAGSVAMIQGGTTSGNTNGYISFHTDSGGTSAERMRILSDGKVGIGSSSAAALLTLAGNSDSGDSACSIHIIDNDSTSGSAVPNISFRSGASTQIYGIRANDTLGLTFRNSSDASKVVFDDDGKVGIGETAPSYHLHVNSGGTGTVAQFKSTGTTAKIMFNNSGSNACFLGSQNNNLFFQTNNTNRMFISTAGLVGIGTTSPVAHLTVGNGTTDQTIAIDKGTGSSATLSFLNAGSNKVYIQADANEHLRIATNNSVKMSILENGNVGIGETNPTETLHVNGNLKVTGTVDVGSSGFSVSSGFILPFGGGTAPSGWLECDGAAVSRSTYSDLFAIIGTIYGAGDGSTTFNLPDLQGRVIMSQGGSTVNRTPADLENIGDTFGSQTHSLQVSELPAHNHAATTTYNPINGSSRNDNTSSALQATGRRTSFRGVSFKTTISNTGGNEGHNNIQPSIVINYLIKT